MGASKKPSAAPVAAQTPQYGSNYQQGTTTTSQQFTPWAKAQPTYDAMAAQMNAQAARGPQYVGPSAQTQQGWNAAQAAIPGMQSAANTALGNYEFLSRAADVANNPYVQGMMGNNRAAAQRSLTEDFLPALGNQSQAAGGMGGSRQGVAQGMATDRAMRSMLEANNSLSMGAYSQGLAAQQSALGSLGAVQQGMMVPGSAYGAIGQSREGYQQAAQDAPWRYLQNLGAAQQYLNPLGALSGTSKANSYSANGPEGAYGPNGAVPPAPAPQYPQQQPWGQPQQYPQYPPWGQPPQ